MAKRVVAGVLASLLMVIVCVGAIIGLVHSTKNARSDSLHSLHTTSKATMFNLRNSLCANALHKESCELMLTELAPKPTSQDSRFESSLAQDPSAQTKVFKGFVEASLKELEAAADLVTGVGSRKLVGRTAAAKRDCNMLLTDALRHAKEAVALVGDDNIKDLSTKADNIVRKFTSCMTFMYTCVDGFEKNTKLKSDMDRILKNATITTSNAMAVIHKFSPSTKVTTPPKSVHGTSRKLLGYSIDRHGYPEWLSAGDRRLLQDTSLEPNMTVSKDGSGDYKTISDAIKNIPSNYTGRYVIYVKAGVYDEIVTVPLEKENLTMYGDGMDKSIITGSMADSGSVSKLESPFVVSARYFIAKDMGFRNTAGPNGHQSVAVRTTGDFITFYQCKIESYQDTLFAFDGRQFFRDCTISGTIDFIFGNAAAVFQNCKIVLRTPQHGAANVILANGRTQPESKTGLVLHDCDIIPDTDFESSCSTTGNYLGRPWKEYSRAIIMESRMSECIHPDGWLSWQNSTTGLSTLVFAEYGNSGPGAATDKRVKWPGYHVLTKSDVAYYTVENFLTGSQWIDTTGVPSTAGLTS